MTPEELPSVFGNCRLSSSSVSSSGVWCSSPRGRERRLARIVQFRSVSATLRNVSCRSEQWGQWEESSLHPVLLSGWLLSDRADTIQIPSNCDPGFHLPLSYTHILIGLEPNVSVSVLGIPLPSSTHSFSVLRPFSSLRPRSAVSPLDNVQAILHRVHAPACSASCLVGANVRQIQTRVLVSVSFPAESCSC